MKNALVVLYIDGVFEHRYEYNSSGMTAEQTLSHVLDDQKRIATAVTGELMGQPEPVQYFLDDYLGSSSVVLKDDGCWISREEYYPFGETSFGSYGKKRYRFCGKERDEESGLYYYGMRYYAPWVCRFVSVDALAHETPFFSPYAYADDNPVMNNDPTGNQSEAVEPGGGNNITDGGGGTSTGQSAGVNEHTGDYIFHSIDGNRLYNVGPDRNWDYADRDSETGLFINFKTIDPLKPDMDALGTINAIKGESDYIRSAEERYKTAAGALYMGTPGSVSESASAEYWSKTWDNPYRTSLFGVPANSGNVTPNYVEFDLALLAYSAGTSIAMRPTQTVGRVFWSGNGNPAVEAAAKEFATKHGMVKLEQTRAGKNLLQLTKGMPWEEQAPMWERLSSVYAKGAKGTVHVFHNAESINAKSVWGRIEYPILKSNKVKIIYHLIK